MELSPALPRTAQRARSFQHQSGHRNRSYGGTLLFHDAPVIHGWFGERHELSKMGGGSSRFVLFPVHLHDRYKDPPREKVLEIDIPPSKEKRGRENLTYNSA